MSQPRPPSGDPATRLIVAINVVVFALELLAGPRWRPLVETFELTRSGLASGAWWQLVTYQFLHGGELHLLMNMLGLWFAGRELERVVGTGRFVALYLGGGVIAGLAQLAFSSGDNALIGASGSVFAVVLALTTLFPRVEVTALLLFVIPVRMRARTLGIGLVAFSMLFWLSGLAPGIGHLAHLGGAAAGWAFGRANRRLGSRGGFIEPPGPAPWSEGSGAATPPPLPGDGPARRGLPSMDDVLAKVLKSGIDSLSREERRILEDARRVRPRPSR